MLWSLLALLLLLSPCALPQTDVLIVGAGIAGLTTALEASQRGANVLVADISSVFGGHAVASEGGLCLIDTPLQRANGIQDSPEVAERDFLAWGRDANPEWVRLYTQKAGTEVHDWMIRYGIRFDRLYHFPGNSVPRFHFNPRRGFGLVEPIYLECLRSGRVRFAWNTRITGLLTDAGKVTGAEGINERTGKSFRVAAAATVIATGGFQSNLERVRANWPAGVPLPPRILIGSGANSLGSGLDLVKPTGALVERLDHQWNYARGLPDPRYPGSNRGLHILAGEGTIWVNAKGERYADEKTERDPLNALLRQPGSIAWYVFDQEGKKRVWISGTDWADPARVEREILNNPQLSHQSDTLESLAAKAGFPAAAFLKTAANAPRPLHTPPFYSVAIYPLTRKSMGGVAIDMQMRVLDRNRRPIAGLYAAGEVTGQGGLNGRAGLEGTFLGPSILQGRMLGRNLGEQYGGSRQVTEASSHPRTAAAAHPAANSRMTCQSCHSLQKYLETPRKGYWHFERSHRVVMEKSWECQSCHAELAPFKSSNHRIDRIAQVTTCVRCHLAKE